MGYMKHNAIVVTSWNEDHIQKAHELASSIFPQVSDITPETMNRYRSFFIPPDGSKEGWKDSDVGDDRREQFMRALSTEQFKHSECGFYGDAVDVRFGGDDDVNTATSYKYIERE